MANDVTVSNRSELISALENASGGETILLKSGDYGDIEVTNKSFGDFVTIKSADVDQRAEFSQLDIANSSHLSFENIHVNNDTNGVAGQGFVNITGSSFINLTGSEINGSVDGQYTVTASEFSDSYGLEVSGNSKNINISDNFIHDAGHGAVFLGVEQLVVSGNVVNDIGCDTFKFSGIVDGLIEDNRGATYVHPDVNDHVDFIQFQGSGSNIVLRGNVLLPGDESISQLDGKVYQGIFLKDGVFTNIDIEQNLIYTNTVNAIYVQSNNGTGGDVTIRNNTVLSPPDITKWNSADIRIVELAGDYTVENNISDHIVISESGGTVNGNITAQFSNPNGANYYNDLYADALAGSGATVADFAIVPGSVAAAKGAFERIAELNGGGAPDNTAPVANDDALQLDEGTSAAIDALANDTDADGDGLAIANFTQPQNGTITHDGAGGFTYTAGPGFSGDDSFRYTVTDGALTSSATVDITVSEVDEPGGGGGSVPTDIGGLALWLDASDGSSIIADLPGSGAVGAWRDLSGLGNDAVQADGGHKPELGQGSLGGRTALIFDGADDHLDIANASELNDGGSYDEKTLMIVFETGDDVDGRQVLYEEGGHIRGLNMYLDDGRLYFNGWNLAETAWGPRSVSTDVEANTAYQATLVLNADGDVLTGRVNGKLAGSVDGVGTLYRHSGEIGVGAVSGMTVFHDGVGREGANNFDGKIGEMIFFNQALEYGDQAAAEAYLADKWLSDGPDPVFSFGPRSFDGTTASAVVLPHEAAYEVAEGTIAMTFSADDLAGFQGLLSKDAYGYGTGGHVGVFLVEDELRIRMQSADDDVDIVVGADIRADIEYDLAITFGSGGLDIYLDGVRIGGDDSWTSGLTGNNESILIGANQWASDPGSTDVIQDAFNGDIDELSIYAEAFSQQMLADIF